MLEDDGLTATTAVGIDRDKNSQQAVKWAVDHLVGSNPLLVLIHVRIATPHCAREGSHSDAKVAEMFRSYRLYCARKAIKVREVTLDDTDVSRALIEYTNGKQIANIVVGASNRNAITRKFRNPDVPTTLMKSAPDFCTVYVILKGKATSVRAPKAPASNASAKTTTTARTVPSSPRCSSVDSIERNDPLSRTARGGWKVPLAPPSTKGPRGGIMSRRRSDSADELDIQDVDNFLTAAFIDSHDQLSSFENDSPWNPTSPSGRDMEAELKRLKLELKQTMDMYSNACKEAVSAKQKAEELHQRKMEEMRRVEEARQAEEAALEMAEMEKARCKAAIEAAQAAQRIAELEAKKRLNAEEAAKREAEEKKRALDVLAQNDVRYRKYTIDEIEVATDNFADALKIGEGGYGPVYRATLGHTPVAIKVLRPDAAQGRKQFQQEVEVLCCMRHPHMVLLLGACPEYGCLVYEYMDNGSLDDRLFRRGNTPPIPWCVRFKIAAEIATGLLFLHQAKPEPLVHRDLKPPNILLDRNYVSKIADVGLARLVPQGVANSVTQYRLTSTAGTFCYIDPEYQQTGMLVIKSDVYSFGILLLQIITAKSPMGLSHQVESAIESGTLTEVLDPTIKDWPMEETLSFAKIAVKCSQLSRKDRPDLETEILPELNRLRRFGDEWESAVAGSPSQSTAASSSPSNTRPWWSHT